IGILIFSASPWIILAILSSLGMIAMFAETMILPAIPDFIEDFDISYENSSWILAVFLVMGAVMTPIAGKLADIYGKKKVLLIILAVYSLGLLLGALSTNFLFMVIARAIQGIGISIFPIAFSIIRDKFVSEKLAVAQGIFSSMLSAGAVIGLVVGASVIENFGWRATFLFIIPIAVTLFAIIKKFIDVKENEKQHTVSDKNSEFCCRFIHVRKDILLSESTVTGSGNLQESIVKRDNQLHNSIDILGAITLSITIVSFLILLQLLEKANNFTEVAILSLAAIISLVLFVIIERKTETPLIDFKLLTNKVILSANIVNMVVGLTALMVVYQSIPILIRSPTPAGFGGDALSVANIQLPYMIVSLIFSIASGFVISRIGNLRPTVMGTIITTIGFFILLLMHATQVSIAAVLVLIAIGLAFMQVGSMNVVLASTPKQFSGISLGMTLLIYLIGASIGPVIAGIYMEANQVPLQADKPIPHTASTSSFPSSESYDLIFLTATLFSGASVAFALYMSRIVRQKGDINISIH
ncbi:MAG TPA: MFS transporter, partial [Nitrososphaeraceae archaeon]|nr:MFS transporter [Nitrososphaeraceae archaeon]